MSVRQQEIAAVVDQEAKTPRMMRGRPADPFAVQLGPVAQTAAADTGTLSITQPLKELVETPALSSSSLTLIWPGIFLEIETFDMATAWKPQNKTFSCF